jgi:ribosomal protein S27E
MTYDPKDPHAIHWTPGLPPEPVDDLIPFTTAELQIARGTYKTSDTLSKWPCPKCGFSVPGFALKGCKGKEHQAMMHRCAYCKHHGLSTGHPKIGDECRICGPIIVAHNGGLHPRKAKKGEIVKGRTLTSEQVVYDLPERLPGPES